MHRYARPLAIVLRKKAGTFRETLEATLKGLTCAAIASIDSVMPVGDAILTANRARNSDRTDFRRVHLLDFKMGKAY